MQVALGLTALSGNRQILLYANRSSPSLRCERNSVQIFKIENCLRLTRRALLSSGNLFRQGLLCLLKLSVVRTNKQKTNNLIENDLNHSDDIL